MCAYVKSEIRTVNGINIETLLLPQPSSAPTTYIKLLSCCLHNFNFCGTIPFPLLCNSFERCGTESDRDSGLASSYSSSSSSGSGAPSKRNERFLCGRRNWGFCAFLHFIAFEFASCHFLLPLLLLLLLLQLFCHCCG